MNLRTFAFAAAFSFVGGTAAAAVPPSRSEEQIVALEKQWATAIQRQDTSVMAQFLSEHYSLVIGVQGEGLKVVTRTAWLDTLKVYKTKSFSIDDLHVQVYGDTAVVFMLFTQQATVKGQDRSAQFTITDVWVKEAAGWRVAERHSSRPEAKTASRP